MNARAPIRALIADDERLMREQLRARLAETWPELAIVAEARNGQEAVDLVAEHQPDLVFLDIRMPGMTGIEAARAIGGRCHVVFITAYDQYAVEAFEQGAVDYVLKPAERERLAVTVQRLKAKLDRPPADLDGLLSALAGRLGVAGAANAKPKLEWIQAAVGQTLRLIPVQEVLFFQSDEKYTRVQTAQVEALIKKPLKELIDELDPKVFWQIHRATLVNVHAIAGVGRDMRGHLVVQLKDHPQKLEVSRSFTHLFKGM
jgi:DNA-binding LytR/AlgR family response regulator